MFLMYRFIYILWMICVVASLAISLMNLYREGLTRKFYFPFACFVLSLLFLYKYYQQFKSLKK